MRCLLKSFFQLYAASKEMWSQLRTVESLTKHDYKTY